MHKDKWTSNKLFPCVCKKKLDLLRKLESTQIVTHDEGKTFSKGGNLKKIKNEKHSRKEHFFCKKP